MTKTSTFIFAILIFFTGCSGYKNPHTESQADYWYQEVVYNLKRNNFEEVDRAFVTLEAEHKTSKLLPEAIILLITAHINQEEYVLADYYISKYMRLFGESKSKDYIEYLRIKSKYLAFSHPKRDQALIKETIKLTDKFILDYPNSRYLFNVETIKTNLKLAEHLINREIIKIYDRLDKPKAVEYYKESQKADWFNEDEIEYPSVFFLRAIFE